MAWSNSKAVGQWNSRLIVEVVLNSQSGNSSNITVRIRLKNGGNSTAFDNNGTSWSMSGGVSASGSDTFSIGAGGTGTLASRSFTVSHNADGNKTISVTVNVGATGTSTFGTPGSLTVSGIKLPRIPQRPSKPGTPTVSNITSSSARINWSHPNNNGAILQEYEVQRATNSGFTSGVVTASGITGTSYTRSGLAANTDYWVRIRVRNSVGWSDWSGGRKLTTKVNSPAAPSNLVATRVNDGRQNLAWSRHATNAAPYTRQELQRQQNGGQWQNVSTNISGTATSFTDSGTVANRRYDYRIRAVNAAGASAWHRVSGDSDISTTPAAPTSLAAKKLANGNIQVSWTPQALYWGVNSYQVQGSASGGAWETLATTGDVTAWSHQNPDASKSWRYRVRAISTGPTLYSAWSSPSNTVQLLAPPLAPSLIGPQGVIDRDESVRLAFGHNPVDTTDQTAGQVRWRVAGGSWATVNTGTNPYYDLPAQGQSVTVEWQARTRGEHATYSPWSPVWSFSTASRPAAVIQLPDETLDQSQVEVVWAYENEDTSAQARWEVQLLDADDNVLASSSGSGTVGQYLFPNVLDDATEYIVRVRVRSGTGLWSEWDTATFVTDFPVPAKAEVFAEWDRENGSVMLTFAVLDPAGDETDPDYIDVQRNDGDGWVTVATEIDPETSIVDYTPRLGEVYYRAISHTTLPSAQIGDETVIEWEHGRDPIFVNAGADFGRVARLIGDQVADSPAIEQASQEWAGWAWPTAVFGEGSSNTIQFTGQIIHTVDHDSSSVDEWKDLLFQRGIVCFRDCQGRKIFGLLGLGFTRTGPVTAVTVTVDQVHYIEGVTDVPELVEAGD